MIGLTVEICGVFRFLPRSVVSVASHVYIALLNVSQIEVDSSDITLMTNIKLFGDYIHTVNRRSFKKLH